MERAAVTARAGCDVDPATEPDLAPKPALVFGAVKRRLTMYVKTRGYGNWIKHRRQLPAIWGAVAKLPGCAYIMREDGWRRIGYRTGDGQQAGDLRDKGHIVQEG